VSEARASLTWYGFKLKMPYKLAVEVEVTPGEEGASLPGE
jgi:hypothetical protein